MRISVIVAIDRINAIGKDNKLIYCLPNDLKRFKNLTTGNTIIMGRNTFLSLPKGALPNRRNIVLTRSQAAVFDGADVFASLEEAISNCVNRAEAGDPQSQEIFIIGGASVYKQALKWADRLCLTVIDAECETADTFFPPISLFDWKETYREHHQPDEKHQYPFAFIDLERAK